jgi:biuret amidohydrolase
MRFQVSGDPHPWPREGNAPSSACAVIVVDMQHDFCSPGYYIDQAGYDVVRLREPIEPVRRVLAVARSAGLQVVYTRHGNVSEPVAGSYPGTAMRGEPGWEIVPELSPDEGDLVVEKSTAGAFASSDLDAILRARRIKHLALCGNTIDVCVHSTLRGANDLGYDCLLLADCCGAVNEGLHRWSVESVRIENGVFGTVANARDFIDAFPRSTTTPPPP